MFLPPIGTRIDVEVAEGTSIGCSQWFSRQTLLFLYMSLIALLVDGLLTAGTLLVILAIGTLAHQMRS